MEIICIRNKFVLKNKEVEILRIRAKLSVYEELSEMMIHGQKSGRESVKNYKSKN